MQKLKVPLLVAVVALFISACALLGVPKSQGFNDDVGIAVSLATTAVNSVDDLRAAGKISAEDASNQLDNIQVLKDGIDIANTVHAVDPAQGDARIQQILISLRSVIDYLQKKEGP